MNHYILLLIIASYLNLNHTTSTNFDIKIENLLVFVN